MSRSYSFFRSARVRDSLLAAPFRRAHSNSIVFRHTPLFPMATENPGSSSSSRPKEAPQSRVLRCPQCKPRLEHKSEKNTRNLVVCIDGTANKFGEKNTNVVKLFSQLDLEVQSPEQFAYYSSGIGTHPNSLDRLERMKRGISDAFDMAIAWNIEEIVKGAYHWLAEKYEDGDQIYLFGFSRGAYQVRVLAGMIHEVGLIRTPTEKQIGEAYGYFEAIRSRKPETRQIAREFKNTFSWALRVHFVGVWDTVSSVGLTRGDPFLSTSSSAAHACHFRHALALDECRVKFMPEYFHEISSQTAGEEFKYIVSPGKGEHTTSSAEEAPHVTGDSPTAGKKNETPDIKEVWFAGCHADVGGVSKYGRYNLSGNVSLLWMRREARQNGLELQPTDLVWVPADLDLGTSNSMSEIWSVIECIPIAYQVSFSGSGANARRPHLFRPRRIIPGQKIHASILYANEYIPRATRGEGFDMLTVQDTDTELDDQIWETGLFDDTAAKALLKYLDSEKGFLPIYLDRLLFMLRSREGRRYVRNVPDWDTRLKELVRRSESEPLVKLTATVAYCEASCDPDITSPTPTEPSQDILDDAEKSFRAILNVQQHQDSPRVIALLKPITKHWVLRKRIFTQEVLADLVKLLDRAAIRSRLSRSSGNFGQAMEGFICLLRCEDTQKIIVGHLAANYHARKSRLSRILETSSYSPQLLVAALRMTLTLARIPSQEAKNACSPVTPRLEQLATRDQGLVSLLAVETLLTLHDSQHPHSFINKTVRANLANALVHLQPEQHYPDEHRGYPALQTLRKFFGLDAENLNDQHKRLIGELKKGVQKGDSRGRVASTMALLKLCESVNIRKYLCEIGLLDVFIDQLRYRYKALVAAYALAVCLKQDDMMQHVNLKEDESLPRNIVNMLRLDYFDDAVGTIEGFQIFGDLMQHDDLRNGIRGYDITAVLNKKLRKGRQKEIRTSLICLDIFQSFDEMGPWTDKLVNIGLSDLRNPVWKVQKAGVTILSALARTNHGKLAISHRIIEIVEMLLPWGYLPIPQSSLAEQPVSSRPPVDVAPPAYLVGSPSWMMGPACALHILAQNRELRRIVHDAPQYAQLKSLHLFDALLDERDTSAWHIKTPNRRDVVRMLDKMIKAVDGKLLEKDFIPIDDTTLPHISHWDRLIKLILKVSVAAPVALSVALPVLLLSLAGTGIAISSDRLYDSFMSHIRRDDEVAGTAGPESSGQEKE